MAMEDVLKSLMAGANVTMMASELLRNGVGRMGEVLADMKLWMEEHEYSSVDELRGAMSHRNCPDPEALERGNYALVLSSWQA